jgi:hypothetical protein
MLALGPELEAPLAYREFGRPPKYEKAQWAAEGPSRERISYSKSGN